MAEFLFYSVKSFVIIFQGTIDYGKEIVFDNEQSFMAEYGKDGCEVIEITDCVVIGEAPDFVLSRR